MAKLTRWTIFWRVFFATLIFGSSANADQAEKAAWNRALDSNSSAGYFTYLSLYPAGEFVDEAVDALKSLGSLTTRGIDISPGGGTASAQGVYQ